MEKRSDLINTINWLLAEEDGHFSHKSIVKMFSQLALIFWFLNDANVVYSDMKLENIIYNKRKGVTVGEDVQWLVVNMKSLCFIGILYQPHKFFA